MISAWNRVVAMTAAGLLLLVVGGCSQEPSVPSIPKSLCWGAFRGEEIAPLLPTGKESQVATSGPEFDVVTVHSSRSCRVYIDEKESFLAWAGVRSTGKGSSWNHWSGRQKTSPVDVGDEGFLFRKGVSSVMLCERPGLPRSPTLSEAMKYVEMAIIVDHAPKDEVARTALPSLLRQYAQFVKQKLKCGNV